MSRGTQRGTGSKRADAAGRAEADASRLIDARIEELGGWRAGVLARVRALIREAVPDVVEEWKWENPVWSLNGIVCTGEAYAKAVKLTFPRGADLQDPDRLFNASLEGRARRAIDIHEGERLREPALRRLVKAAVAKNLELAKGRSLASRDPGAVRPRRS